MSKELETQKNLHALNTTVKNTMDAIVKNFENDFFTPEAYQKFESLSSTLASKR
ncbi:MAG: hypothetical protein H6766_00290 [Candidatus Peribacteria bacterium]|nr:MAG: hypothetical protein H6766_00290 [Candidatus Peribacteria bacterium]